MLPELQKWREHVVTENKFAESVGKVFKDIKDKLLKDNPSLAEQLKSNPEPPAEVDEGADQSKSSWNTVTKGVKIVGDKISAFMPGSAFPVTISPQTQRSKPISDSTFLARILDIIATHPDLAPQLTEAIEAARKHFLSQLLTVTHKAVQKIEMACRRSCDTQMNGIRERTLKEEQNKSRAALLQSIGNRFQRDDEEFVAFYTVSKRTC